MAPFRATLVEAPRPASPWKALALLAGLFTVLNAIKPLQVDDAAYYYYAAQIARHPLDPYGFDIYWYQYRHPANHVLAPPVLPYWWAAAVRLFGDRPVLWKLWLLPVSLLLVFSLHALFRRFARGLEVPLTVLTLLSPTFLPSLNLMLDVPALALALSALVLFFRSGDRGDWRLTAAAGLVAGLAMQTKYTAFLAPAAMLLYAGVEDLLAPRSAWSGASAKWPRALMAASLAGLVFVAWEAFTAWRYGESHFLHEIRSGDHDLLGQWVWALPLLALLGGVNAGGGLLALVGLGRRRGMVVGLAVLIALAYALVALLQVSGQMVVEDAPFPLPDEWRVFPVSLEQVIFTGIGLVVVGSLAVVACRLLRVGRGRLWQARSWSRHREEWFLVLWLGLEVAGYFALTPFGAVRRVMGVVMVGTILAGRLASWTCRRPGRRALVWGVAVGNAVLGLLFYGVDLRDAWVPKRLAEEATAFIRERDAGATIWFVGHWGFQFYAEQSGMKAVVPASTALCQGAWLVVPDAHIEQQTIRWQDGDREPVAELVLDDPIPFRTVRCFYGTATGVPLEHKQGPRRWVRIYRLTRDLAPE